VLYNYVVYKRVVEVFVFSNAEFYIVWCINTIWALLMMSTCCSKHVEAWNKYIKKECVKLVINKNYVKMHGQQNIKFYKSYFTPIQKWKLFIYFDHWFSLLNALINLGPYEIRRTKRIKKYRQGLRSCKFAAYVLRVPHLCHVCNSYVNGLEYIILGTWWESTDTVTWLSARAD
jgi:hypothetical protein